MFSFPVPANNDEKSNMNYNGSVRKELDEEYHNQADDLYEAEISMAVNKICDPTKCDNSGWISATLIA